MLLLLLFAAVMHAQTIIPVKICDLPLGLSETSGLVNTGPNNYLSHNDSGNEPKVIQFDSSGNITRQIKLINATNVDWEDLTKDNKGNIYIGDFGNNNNNRNDLKIYIIFDPKTFSKDSTNAGIINFTYPDQKAFPPVTAQQNFDMEAFFWFNDSLYLFSKNRSNPYSGYTKCYQLPAKAGSYTAKLIDSFFTGNGLYLNYSVTGAAINNAGNKIVLLGYDKCWIFTAFTGRNFFKGKVTMYLFNSLSQKEAVYFESDEKLVITQETSSLGNAMMFRINLPQSSTSGNRNFEKAQIEIEIFPNPVYETFQLKIKTMQPDKKSEVMLYNSSGLKVKSWSLLSDKIHVLDMHELPGGNYYLKVAGGNTKKIIKE
ncbi:MAG: T9SS type A sorting domain-containing protein [Bacteroidia bacterium]|nr:T9SS type A sorting domain-containing protein [Bacteroidia bacterium]